jgi:MFS family permease
LLTRPTIAFTGVVAILYEAAWQGIASFLPTFFIQYHSFSTTFAGVLFAGYFVVQGILQVGVGVAADRFGHDSTIAVCALTGIAAVTLLIRTGSLPTVVFGVGLLGLSMGHSPAVFSRFIDRLADGERSFGFGLFRTSYMIVAAPGSVILGGLADSFGWAVAIGAVAVGLGAVCTLLLTNYVAGSGY